MLLTWLSHAAFLLTIRGGPTILLDPCLSDRCSPLSFAGPKRIVPVPVTLPGDAAQLHEDGTPFDGLPDVDIVIISHNHYDHLDLPTLKKVVKPHTVTFVPLGSRDLLVSQGLTNVVECDWWDEYRVGDGGAVGKASGGGGGSGEGAGGAHVRVACTPCQHFSSRTAFDRNETLWSSWVVSVYDNNNNNNNINGGGAAAGAGDASRLRGRFFFAGDTGYRTVLEGEDASSVPTCPAFREVGAKYGPFALSAIPIGAYAPRHLMSGVHCDPRDAVDVHVDVRSAHSVAMHWGTFLLAWEPATEPPVRLREEMERRGLDPRAFHPVEVGETVEA